MTHLPLGIPPLPAPPAQVPVSGRGPAPTRYSVTMAYAAGLAPDPWTASTAYLHPQPQALGNGTNVAQSQSQSQHQHQPQQGYFPPVPPPPATSSATTHAATDASGRGAGAKESWKSYMQSLGTQMAALDVGDKPLPPIPGQNQNQNQNAKLDRRPAHPNSYYAAQHGYAPQAHVAGYGRVNAPPVLKPAAPPPAPIQHQQQQQQQWYPPPVHILGSPYALPYPPVPPPPSRPVHADGNSNSASNTMLSSSSNAADTSTASSTANATTNPPSNAGLSTRPPPVPPRPHSLPPGSGSGKLVQTKLVLSASGKSGSGSSSGSGGGSGSGSGKASTPNGGGGKGTSGAGAGRAGRTSLPTTFTTSAPPKSGTSRSNAKTKSSSKPATKSSSTAASKRGSKGAKGVIDLTADSDTDGDDSDSGSGSHSGSDAYADSSFDAASYLPSDDDLPRVSRHARAHSAQPRLQRIVPTTPIRSPRPRPRPGSSNLTPRQKSSAATASLSVSPSPFPAAPTSAPPSPSPSPSTPSLGAGAVQCAGFTRTGAPCKRTVKTAAPYLAHASSDDGEDGERVTGRYCKDHAGLVCAASGFYWRDARGKAGVWIDFDDYIPMDLGQQTQTLLRMTMESPLTAKELPGFLYAYELRSLHTPTTTYFKVGRTDNVPRRIGQWSNQCTSHTPTLRDIFPLKAPAAASGLHRRPSAPGSLLPGAVKGGVDARRMVPAVKRWERLVHLELADRASTLRGTEYDALAQPCADCGAIHKEIFPLADGAGLAAYENIVVDAIGRWEKFIRTICD